LRIKEQETRLTLQGHDDDDDDDDDEVQVLKLQLLEFPSRFYRYFLINKCLNISLSLKILASSCRYVFTFGYTGILGRPRQISYRES